MQWSEYEKHLWCSTCKEDFVPKHWGILDGPVPVTTAGLLGIDFRMYVIGTGELVKEEDMRKFRLTGKHIKLLKSAYVGWNDCEYGAPCVEPKRPYGNSDVLRDVYRIVYGQTWDDSKPMSDQLEAELDLLHLETKTALQIVLQLRTFKPGTFVFGDNGKWKRQ